MNAKKSKSSRSSATDPLAPEGRLSEAAALLAFAAPPVKPPPHLKKALLARVAASQAAGQRGAVAPKGWRFSRFAANEGWIALPIPNVRLRELTIDRERDTALLFIEMAPGAIFPDHTHAGPERGFVLSGDFQTGDRVLRAGDFYEAKAGTEHTRISSPSGCTGLLWVSAAAWENWRTTMAK